MPFTAVPAVPAGNNPTQYYQVLTAIKENVDLLTGSRGGTVASKAILRGDVTAQLVTPTFQGVSATGAAINVNGQQVPALVDFVLLVNDVTTLANDVATLRATVNRLISQLRG